MGVVHARVQTDFINFFFRQDILIVFKYMYIKERSRITVYTQLLSYM